MLDPSRWNDRMIAMKRQLMVRALKSRLGLVVVNEFPKSGGTWIGGF